MKNIPSPWCGVAALKALHAPYAAKAFAGVEYAQTRFDEDFDKWSTVYLDNQGREHVVIEMWIDPEGKTSRMAVEKFRRGLLH